MLNTWASTDVSIVPVSCHCHVNPADGSHHDPPPGGTVVVVVVVGGTVVVVVVDVLVVVVGGTVVVVDVLVVVVGATVVVVGGTVVVVVVDVLVVVVGATVVVVDRTVGTVVVVVVVPRGPRHRRSPRDVEDFTRVRGPAALTPSGVPAHSEATASWPAPDPSYGSDTQHEARSSPPSVARTTSFQPSVDWRFGMCLRLQRRGR
jgi:hypothetical protein